MRPKVCALWHCRRLKERTCAGSFVHHRLRLEAGRRHSGAEGELLGGLVVKDLGTRHGHEVGDTPPVHSRLRTRTAGLVSKTDKASKALSSSSQDHSSNINP